MTRPRRPTRSTSSSPTCAASWRPAERLVSCTPNVAPATCSSNSVVTRPRRRQTRPRGARIAALFGRVRTPYGGRLRPSSWPVRWRLAAVSAGLTLAILLVFGAVIGQVATSRIRDDFNRQVGGAAQTLAAESHVFSAPLGTVIFRGPKLDDFVRPDGASARVFDAEGNLVKESTGAEQ